jgi:ribosomal protein L12E/L44/L45/RPP1/RPP2
MKTLTDYLEEIKAKKGFETDVELADFLGIKRSSLCVMKQGGGASQETAERIAAGAGVALEEVWLASLIQKEQNPKFKHVLENISKLSGLAASIAIACILTGNDAQAGVNQPVNNNLHVIHYAKSYVGALALQIQPSKRVMTVLRQLQR